LAEKENIECKFDIKTEKKMIFKTCEFCGLAIDMDIVPTYGFV
jgi:hypothetical protein